MAFRRSLTARAKVFYQQQQRVALPLSSRVDRDDNDRRRQELQIHDLRRRGGGGNNAGIFSRNLCGDRRFAAPAAFAPAFVRNMSSSSKGEGLGAENAPITSDGFEMVKETAEKAVEAVAPAANEMAAVATGLFPVDVFQQLIHHVHTFSGCNWLATIALSTILLRTLLLPLTIHQTRATYIFTLIRHEVKEIQREISKSRNEKNPIAAAVGEARMRKLLNEYGLNRFTSAASLAVLVSGNLCFLVAMMIIMNAQGVNDGGASYIFPLLTAFTFWRAMKCHGDAIITSKSIGVVAALLVPFSAILHSGMLCSWIASNLYGLLYGTVIKNGKVKKMLGIPNIAEAPRFEVDPLVMPASIGEWIVPAQNVVVFLLFTLSIQFS